MSDNLADFHRLTDLVAPENTTMSQTGFRERMTTLAFAIEQHGVQKIDTLLGIVNGDEKKAVQLMGHYVRVDEDALLPGSNANPMTWHDNDNELNLFGWTTENLPDFNNLKANVPTVRRHNLRQTMMDGVIDTVMKGEPELDYHAAFLKLKEIALDGIPPFTGELLNGALIYANDKNEFVPFTKDALKKRLERRKNR
jgi:hypothetical protein